MFAADRKSYKDCSQLLGMIRYQLGSTDEFIKENKCFFPTGQFFSYAEGNRDDYRDKENRHSVSFSWIILRQQLEGAVTPDITSPDMIIKECPRKWHLNITKNVINNRVEYDVYLKCNDCKDTSIPAYVTMDLYRGTNMIGEEAKTSVSFDNMVDRHLVYTGTLRSSLEDIPATNIDLDKAYTIQGILNIKNCCVDEPQCFPLLGHGLPTRY